MHSEIPRLLDSREKRPRRHQVSLSLLRTHTFPLAFFLSLCRRFPRTLLSPLSDRPFNFSLGSSVAFAWAWSSPRSHGPGILFSGRPRPRRERTPRTSRRGRLPSAARSRMRWGAAFYRCVTGGGASRCRGKEANPMSERTHRRRMSEREAHTGINHWLKMVVYRREIDTRAQRML